VYYKFKRDVVTDKTVLDQTEETVGGREELGLKSYLDIEVHTTGANLSKCWRTNQGLWSYLYIYVHSMGV
jgi:hypothetical protein